MSIKAKMYNQEGEQTGDMDLSSNIFGLKMNEALVHQAVITQMANERQVLAHTKDRSEVRGGGKKPWRQKGTGRARVGSNRSPIWIGGGVTFGPTKDRNFKKDINRKMKQKALFIALSDKVNYNNLTVLDGLNLDDFKTKKVNEILDKLESKIENKKEGEKTKRSILFVNDKKDDKIKYSIRNLGGVKFINLDNINIVDLLKYRNLIITKESVKKIEEKYKK